jgi:hypothetical protein
MTKWFMQKLLIIKELNVFYTIFDLYLKSNELESKVKSLIQSKKYDLSIEIYQEIDCKYYNYHSTTI